MISRLVPLLNLTLHWLIPRDSEQFEPHDLYQGRILYSCFTGSLSHVAAASSQPGVSQFRSCWHLRPSCSLLGGKRGCPLCSRMCSRLSSLGLWHPRHALQSVATKHISRCGYMSPRHWEEANLSPSLEPLLTSHAQFKSSPWLKTAHAASSDANVTCAGSICADRTKQKVMS